MGFEISKTLIVSSCHITEHDITLNKMFNLFPHEGYKFGNRFFCLDGVQLEALDVLPHKFNLGSFSREFKDCIKMAKVLECDRIEFDADGDIITEHGFDSSTDINGE